MLENAAPPAKGSGWVGSGAWAKANLGIGPMSWADRRVLVMDDFQSMSNNIRQRVDGIIGEDVLKEFQSVMIDFQRHRLFFVRR